MIVQRLLYLVMLGFLVRLGSAVVGVCMAFGAGRASEPLHGSSQSAGAARLLYLLRDNNGCAAMVRSGSAHVQSQATGFRRGSV